MRRGAGEERPAIGLVMYGGVDRCVYRSVYGMRNGMFYKLSYVYVCYYIIFEFECCSMWLLLSLPFAADVRVGRYGSVHAPPVEGDRSCGCRRRRLRTST